MKIASYGQAAMHALQPMQRACRSRRCRPARRYIAVVGQAVTHGASSHWLQRVTWKRAARLGNVPDVDVLDVRAVTPSGTSFSDLQAVVQAWQPMQRVWSMTFP